MGVYTRQLYDNTLYINKIQKTLLSEFSVEQYILVQLFGQRKSLQDWSSITCRLYSAKSEGYLWLATGGKSQLSQEKLSAAEIDITVSDILQRYATEEQRKNGGCTMWVHFDPPKKKNPLRSDSEWVAGGDSRSRTDDPLLAKQVL